MFDDLKKKTLNGNVLHTNLDDSGFGSYLSGSARRETLDQMMSSHINVVNVSKPKTETASSSSNTLKPIQTAEYAKYKKGVRVRHNHFGEGIITLGITDFASAFVTIQFDKVGIKTLSLKYANLEIIEA